MNTETAFRKGSHVVQIEQTWEGKNELVVLHEHGMKNLLSEVVVCRKNVNVTGSSGANGTMSVPIAPRSEFARACDGLGRLGAWNMNPVPASRI